MWKWASPEPRPRRHHASTFALPPSRPTSSSPTPPPPPTSERQGFVHPWDAHPHHHVEHIHFVQEEIGEPTIVAVSGGLQAGRGEREGGDPQKRRCCPFARTALSHRTAAAAGARGARRGGRGGRVRGAKCGRRGSPGRRAGSAGGPCQVEASAVQRHRSHRTTTTNTAACAGASGASSSTSRCKAAARARQGRDRDGNADIGLRRLALSSLLRRSSSNDFLARSRAISRFSRAPPLLQSLLSTRASFSQAAAPPFASRRRSSTSAPTHARDLALALVRRAIRRAAAGVGRSGTNIQRDEK